MLPKDFLLIAVLLFLVASAKGTPKEVRKNFQELGYNVQFQMIIDNGSKRQTATQFNLELNSSDVTSGQDGYLETMRPPRNITASIKEAFLGHKVGYAATGCAGTVTYEIRKTRASNIRKRFLTVMYSVPYSHDFHSNWLGVWIHGEDEMNKEESLFDRMYYGEDKLGFRRKEYYQKVSEKETLSYGKDNFKVTARMGTSHKPTITVRIQPPTPNNGK